MSGNLTKKKQSLIMDETIDISIKSVLIDTGYVFLISVSVIFIFWIRLAIKAHEVEAAV